MPIAAAPSFWSAIVSAGSAVAGSAIANKGANSAAKTQAAATAHAADLQAKATADALAAEREQQAYDRQQAAAKEQARAPYVQASNASLAQLANVLHVPGGFVPPPVAAPRPAAPAAPMAPATAQPQPSYVPSYLSGTTATPAAAASSMPTDSMVTLVAPNGETKSVPRARAAAYIARGAKQVS